MEHEYKPSEKATNNRNYDKLKDELEQFKNQNIALKKEAEKDMLVYAYSLNDYMEEIKILKLEALNPGQSDAIEKLIEEKNSLQVTIDMQEAVADGKDDELQELELALKIITKRL